MSTTTTTCITNLLPPLRATDAGVSGDLVWWTKKELIRLFDSEMKNIAKRAAVFIRRDTSIILVAGTALYSTPARHVATLYASHKNKPLEPTNTLELEGLDELFGTTAGTPERFYADKIGANKIGLHPVPTSGDVGAGALEIIQAEWAAEVDELESNTTIPTPLCIADYLEACVLREAYKKESDAQMPEVAGQLAQFTAMVEKVIVGYWGGIQ